MKRFSIIIISIISVCFLSCNPCAPATEDDGSKVRGVVFELEEVQTVGGFIQKFNEGDMTTAIVSGKVSDVCKKSGCWMKLVSEDNQEELFVKFKDYGFKMPLDLAGKTITMKGTASKKLLKNDIEFIATGVVIQD